MVVIINDLDIKRENKMSYLTKEETNKLPIFMNHVSDQSLAALSPTQTRFVVLMRPIGPTITADTLKASISKMFPPAHLFAK